MKILVTGGNGLCGSSLQKECLTVDHDFKFVTSHDYDLRDVHQVNSMLLKEKPDCIIHTAAKVGGILANIARPEEFLHDNLLINTNLIRSCVTHKINRLFAFSSVCVFSDNLSLLEEDKINDGPVYGTNAAYGYAKRIVDTHIVAAKQQYGFTNWCSIIPGNIFGSHDMFSIAHGHVIPSVMYKMFLAKTNNTDLKMIGDGLSLREFIYVDDLSRAILQLLDKEIPDKIIISGKTENSIRDIVELMADVANFTGEIIWDTSTLNLNGQRSRPSSKDRLYSLLPNFEYTSLESGLRETWDWFVSNYPNIRTEYRL